MGSFGFKTKNVEFPTSEKGETYHIGTKNDNLPKYWIIPGSYERAECIKELWTDLNTNPCPNITRPHQYHMITGKYKSVPMGICSTGIGSPAAEVSIVEMIFGGGRHFIRAGTCGGNDPEIMSGDVVIVNEARGNVGTVMEYLGKKRMFDYVQLNHQMIKVLEQACVNLGLKRIAGKHERGKGFKIGRGYCADSFYGGQGRTAFCSLTEETSQLLSTLENEGVLSIEMETAGIAALIKAYQERASAPYNEVTFASILTPAFNRRTGDCNEDKQYQMQLLKIASEAFVMLDKESRT